MSFPFRLFWMTVEISRKAPWSCWQKRDTRVSPSAEPYKKWSKVESVWVDSNAGFFTLSKIWKGKNGEKVRKKKRFCLMSCDFLMSKNWKTSHLGTPGCNAGASTLEEEPTGCDMLRSNLSRKYRWTLHQDQYSFPWIIRSRWLESQYQVIPPHKTRAVPLPQCLCLFLRIQK